MRSVLCFMLIACIFSLSANSTTFSNINKEIISGSFLNLRFDFDLKKLHGNYQITFYFNEETDYITLDTRHLNIIQITDELNNSLNFTLDQSRSSEVFGTPLVINLPVPFSPTSNYTINIIYETSEESEGLIWFNSNQTISKKFPFVYAQTDKINLRSILPTQDTLLNRNQMDVNYKLETPILGVGYGFYYNLLEYGTISNYTYAPLGNINPNQITFAAGQLQHNQIGFATALWAQNDILEIASKEFSNLETYFQQFVKYFGYQACSTFNILVLPSGFPFRANNGYCLSLVSPSLIAGDKSLETYLIREVAANWFDSQVSSTEFSNIWIPKALATYTSRKILKDLKSQEVSQLVCYQTQKRLIKKINEIEGTDQFNLSQLTYVPSNPNDIDDEIISDKGSLFFEYLEGLIGESNVFSILNSIIPNNLISNSILNSTIENYIKQNFNNSDEILEQLIFDKWISQPGLPPVKFEFTSELETKAKFFALSFISGNIDSQLLSEFNSWDVYSKLEFIDVLRDNKEEVNEKIYLSVRNTLNLYQNQNAEILFAWFELSLSLNFTIDNVNIYKALSTTGRIDLVLPIYKELVRIDKDNAESVYKSCNSLYVALTNERIMQLFN